MHAIPARRRVVAISSCLRTSGHGQPLMAVAMMPARGLEARATGSTCSPLTQRDMWVMHSPAGAGQGGGVLHSTSKNSASRSRYPHHHLDATRQLRKEVILESTLVTYSPQLPALVSHPQPHRCPLARQFKQERYTSQATLGRELVFQGQVTVQTAAKLIKVAQRSTR